MWIFGSLLSDLLILFLPGIAACSIGWFLGPASNPLTYFFVFALIDGGHVYTTHLRTYANRSETRSASLYWIVPPTAALIAGILYHFRLPGFWRCFLYLTMFHHWRQYYGITRWYQKIHQRFCRTSNYFLFTLTFIPAVLFHLRQDINIPDFSASDLLNSSNQILCTLLSWIYMVTVVAWLGFEYRLLLRGHWEPGRLLSIASATLLVGLALLMGTSTMEVLIPLTVAHGIAYLGLMVHSLRLTQPRKYPNLLRATLGVIAVCVVAGSVHGWLESLAAKFDAPHARFWKDFSETTVVAFLVTAYICHYVYDAVLWKTSHREGHLLYANLPDSSLERKAVPSALEAHDSQGELVAS